MFWFIYGAWCRNYPNENFAIETCVYVEARHHTIVLNRKSTVLLLIFGWLTHIFAMCVHALGQSFMYTSLPLNIYLYTWSIPRYCKCWVIIPISFAWKLSIFWMRFRWYALLVKIYCNTDFNYVEYSFETNSKTWSKWISTTKTHGCYVNACCILTVDKSLFVMSRDIYETCIDFLVRSQVCERQICVMVSVVVPRHVLELWYNINICICNILQFATR